MELIICSVLQVQLWWIFSSRKCFFGWQFPISFRESTLFTVQVPIILNIIERLWRPHFCKLLWRARYIEHLPRSTDLKHLWRPDFVSIVHLSLQVQWFDVDRESPTATHLRWTNVDTESQTSTLVRRLNGDYESETPGQSQPTSELSKTTVS